MLFRFIRDGSRYVPILYLPPPLANSLTHSLTHSLKSLSLALSAFSDISTDRPFVPVPFSCLHPRRFSFIHLFIYLSFSLSYLPFLPSFLPSFFLSYVSPHPIRPCLFPYSCGGFLHLLGPVRGSCGPPRGNELAAFYCLIN
jgi:hypothetical protein